MNDDRVVFDRRDFLKLVGIGVAGVTAGCAKPPAEKLIPYLVAPEDILPGVPYFYASTCRECPAGCGLIVRTREGRSPRGTRDRCSHRSRARPAARPRAPPGTGSASRRAAWHNRR